MAPENGHDDGEGNRSTVFIDTSLETHLATIVSDSDTVSDLKRKIVLEHRQCFPAIGDIKIHCLKVKRRGNYYHLSDSMLVKSAFSDSQKNWFLSVDASHLEQCDGIQHKPGDQLALPWVKDGISIDRIDNHTDKPSKLSLIHGSTSNHPKIVPFLNQKLPSVDHFTSDDSCKKVSKNIEEDRSSNLEQGLNQHLDSKEEEKLNSVNEEIKSKKRTRDMHNEDPLKKRRKSQRLESNVKASEEKVLTDVDKVKDMGTSVNDENSIEDKSRSKNATLNDEDTRTMLVNQKKKPKRAKKVKNSSHDQVANVVPLSVENVGEEIRFQKNTEASEVIPDVAVVMEKNIPEEIPLQLSQKEKSNELVQEADIGNEIEIPSSSMKEVTAEDELLVKHDDDHVVDISSTVPTPVFDEKKIDEEKKDDVKMINDEKNELVDDSVVIQNKKSDDDLIVKEVKIPEPIESHRSRKSRKEIKEVRSKKKDVGKSSKKDEIVNTETFMPPERKESLDNNIQVENDAEILKTETKTSELNVEVSEKQNEKMDDTKKTKKKKKTKKLTARNEGYNGNLQEKIADVPQVDVDKNKPKDAQISDEGLLKKSKKNHQSKPEESKIPEVPLKDMTTVSQVPKGNDVNSDVDIPKEGSHDIDFMEYFSPSQQPNKTVLDNVESKKETMKLKKPKKKSKEEDENNKGLLASKKVPEGSIKINPEKTSKKIEDKRVQVNKPQASSESSSESYGRSFRIKKINKQKPTVVKDLKKNVPGVKSLLNTPGTIFGDNSDDSSADDNANVNSDSGTRTPSRKSSSSGESDSSIDSKRYGSHAVKRKEAGGKNNMNSQSRPKNTSIADLLRSSSRFKKARLTASKVNDTESEPVDFVPESQPVD
ncbi:hypothetical protein L1887_14991 [Cichorium endivia]|nr:hypothetical protein L1887_14991 [Cichorium endivia]